MALRSKLICGSALALAALLAGAPTASFSQPPMPPGFLAGSGPVPRTADGHPDLTALWNGLPDGRRPPTDSDFTSTENKNVQLFSGRHGDLGTVEQDGRLGGKASDDVPQYKPEFWDKVNDLELHTFKTDPSYGCGPQGVPRIGAPFKILQTPTEVVLFYSIVLRDNEFRIVPITGRDHFPDDLLVGTYNGDSVGHWEGDTLVIDVQGFNDVTWIATGGFFHTADMHVVERLTRISFNRLKYQVTVEDPGVLTKPWVTTRVLNLDTDPNASIEELPPCSERDADKITLNIR
jgi:hypothetical protein